MLVLVGANSGCAPARITLLPDRGTIRADGEDLSFVTVRVEDKDGNFCLLADNLVNFKLSGPGKIAAAADCLTGRQAVVTATAR